MKMIIGRNMFLGGILGYIVAGPFGMVWGIIFSGYFSVALI